MPPRRLLPLPAPGPEDVVLDAEGRVLTGVADGRLLSVDPGTGAVVTLADTGGRPLGLAACPDGSVLVCDSRRGLLRVHPVRDGDAEPARVEVLVDRVDGARLNFASNVVLADDGTIYFSASSRRVDLEHYLGDLFEHSGTGRLFRLHPDGTLDTLLDGLQFANGVVVLDGGASVLVAETGAYRITRHHLTGPAAGTSEPFAENLPGFPDNMALGSDGLVWVALASPRNPVLDRLAPLPGLLRTLAWLLPHRLLPAPARTTWVLGFTTDGRPVHDLQAAGEDFAFVTGVAERAGVLYLGSLHEPAIAVVEVPATADRELG